MKSINPFDRSLILVDSDFVSDSWNNFFKDFGQFENSVFKAAPQKTLGFQPTCDITEAKDHYMITLDVPGVSQEQLTIEVENQQLKISGEKHKEITDKNDETKHIYFERSFGKFTRTFNLPPEIKSEDIQAHYQDGVLKVAIPKVKKEEPKKISIGVSSEKPSFFKKLVSSTQ